MVRKLLIPLAFDVLVSTLVLKLTFFLNRNIILCRKFMVKIVLITSHKNDFDY